METIQEQAIQALQAKQETDPRYTELVNRLVIMFGIPANVVELNIFLLAKGVQL